MIDSWINRARSIAPVVSEIGSSPDERCYSAWLLYTVIRNALMIALFISINSPSFSLTFRCTTPIFLLVTGFGEL
jgi:hypothetical protein